MNGNAATASAMSGCGPEAGVWGPAAAAGDWVVRSAAECILHFMHCAMGRTREATSRVAGRLAERLDVWDQDALQGYECCSLLSVRYEYLYAWCLANASRFSRTLTMTRSKEVWRKPAIVCGR